MSYNETKTGLAFPEATRVEMAQGDIVGIDAKSGPYAGGFEIMPGSVTFFAEATLGGATTEEGIRYPAQKLYLLEVNNIEDRDLQKLIERARDEGVDTSPFLVMTTDEEGIVSGAAFLPPQPKAEKVLEENGPHSIMPITIIGREGNLKWFHFGPGAKMPEGWTPFDDNESVSRQHIEIAGAEGKYAISRLAADSFTEVASADPKIVHRDQTEQIVASEAVPTKKLGALALVRNKLRAPR